MNYRKLRKTGIMVSEVGMGIERGFIGIEPFDEKNPDRFRPTVC